MSTIRGHIRDRNTDRRQQLMRIPYHLFGLLSTHTHGIPTGTGTVTTDPGGEIVGMDDGAPEVAEVSTFGYGGIEIAAAGDSMTCLDLVTPTLWDWDRPIGVRVVWVDDVAVPATTDSVTWVVTYAQDDPGEALAAPSTALDTVIAAHTPGVIVGQKLRRSARGIINANTFDEAASRGAVAWNVEADVLTGYSADEVKFLALEIDYWPLYFKLPTQRQNANTSQAAA